MNLHGRVLLLNGAGSAGKTSIARALQSILDEPYLHLQMDAFMDMLPERYQEHLEGFFYERLPTDQAAVVAVGSGPVGERLLRGMRRSVVAMAQEGNNLIVDDVLLGPEWEDYERLLAGFELCRIGVFASLDVLERRERERGDRRIGLARWQYDQVHASMTYDLEVDTSQASPLDCAHQIKTQLRL